MENIIMFILHWIGQFIGMLNFPMFSNGITFLQFILAVPIAIALIKLVMFSFTQYVDKSDFSVFGSLSNSGVVYDHEIYYESNIDKHGINRGGLVKTVNSVRNLKTGYRGSNTEIKYSDGRKKRIQYSKNFR